MNDHPVFEEPELPELATVARAIDPASSLESAVVSALYARGALRRRRKRQAWIAAAIAAAFAGGLLVGRELPRDVPDRVSPGTTVTWF